MIDFDFFRREDSTINLKEAFISWFITNTGPHTLTSVGDLGLSAALDHINCVEAFLPIKSKRTAAVVLANAYSIALAYTRFSQPKEPQTNRVLTAQLTDNVTLTLKAKTHV